MLKGVVPFVCLLAGALIPAQAFAAIVVTNISVTYQNIGYLSSDPSKGFNTTFNDPNAAIASGTRYQHKDTQTQGSVSNIPAGFQELDATTNLNYDFTNPTNWTSSLLILDNYAGVNNQTSTSNTLSGVLSLAYVTLSFQSDTPFSIDGTYTRSGNTVSLFQPVVLISQAGSSQAALNLSDTPQGSGSTLFGTGSLSAGSYKFMFGNLSRRSYALNISDTAYDGGFINLAVMPSIASSVPEPGTWLMTIFGLGLVGLAIRRHQYGTQKLSC